MRARGDRSQNTEAYLILGVVFLALGIMPLLSGLYGYFIIVPEVERSQDTVNEKAEELGLGDIPGISVDDDLARLFVIMTLVGCSVIGIGTVLLAIALHDTSRCAQKRP